VDAGCEGSRYTFSILSPLFDPEDLHIVVPISLVDQQLLVIIVAALISDVD
jgi:hypothetical protein